MRKTQIIIPVAIGIAALAFGGIAEARHGHRGGPRGPQRAGPHAGPPGIVRVADANDDRTVTAEEWAAFKATLTITDGAVDVTSLAEALGVTDREGAEDAITRHHDTDGDGVVTEAELDALFDALDRNADGTLTEDDRPGRTRPMGRRARKGGRFVTAVADADESGDVSADEWSDFIASLGADEDGVIDVLDVLALLPTPDEGSRLAETTDEERAAHLLRVLDRDEDDVLEVSDLQAVFDQLDKDSDGALSEDELARQRAC